MTSQTIQQVVLSPETNFMGRIWNGLTRPHPRLTDIESIRQSRLLAGLTLALALTATLASIIFLLRAPGTIPAVVKSSGFGVVLTLVIYFINRSGRYRLSALLFVGLNFIMIHAIPLFMDDLAWLFFTSMLLIVTAILMKPSFTITLFFVSIAYQILLAVTRTSTVSMSNYSALVVFMVTSAMLLVFMNHRSGLERERQSELQAANAALRESEISLERRVNERTRDLEIAAEVSKQMTTILDLHKLLANLVERTRAAFDLYHVSVFVYDPATEILVYEAGTGEAGLRMKAAGKHFNLQDGQGLVPLAARAQQHVLVNDISSEPNHLANPDLPQTHAELVLPMQIGNQLIGVLDLQSERANRFSTDDLKVLTSLAEQLAVAVRNARYYGEQVEIAERLRAVDTIKSQFLASMSHELRTPLNAVLNFTEFVGMGMLGPVNEKQQDALTKALDSGRHLLSLINDVLDMTKIEAGMLKLFVEADIDVNQELSAVVAAIKTLLNEKSVTFVQDIEANLPLVVGDRRRIRQVLLNLLSNAAKFTEEGSVKLSVRRRDDEFLFCVLDTGPGIAPEDQADIFEPFKQTDTGIRHAGGTGLGLPISKRLVEAHGGKLWVESKPGEGAAFYCTFPIRAAELVNTMSLTVSA